VFREVGSQEATCSIRLPLDGCHLLRAISVRPCGTKALTPLPVPEGLEPTSLRRFSAAARQISCSFAKLLETAVVVPHKILRRAMPMPPGTSQANLPSRLRSG
jgi:hypothetical protein